MVRARAFAFALMAGSVLAAPANAGEEDDARQIGVRAIEQLCPALLRGEISLADKKTVEFYGFDFDGPLSSKRKKPEPGVHQASVIKNGTSIAVSKTPASHCDVTISGKNAEFIGREIMDSVLEDAENYPQDNPNKPSFGSYYIHDYRHDVAYFNGQPNHHTVVSVALTRKMN